MIRNQHGHWKTWLRTRERENRECIPLILHIGMEKTGSKAIQTWLADQREKLAEEGWYIPTSLGPINHRQVAFLGYDKSRRDDGTQRRGINTDEELKRYKDEVTKRLKMEVETAKALRKDAMIISTELASSRLIHRREIRKLIISMKEANCSPILVTLFRRNPADLMESRYSTAVLHEGWRGLNPAKAGSKEANLFGDQIGLQQRWWSVIKKIEGVSFDVYAYTKQNLLGGSSAATVANFMGCKERIIQSAKDLRSNRPLPLVNLRALMIMNRLEAVKLFKINVISRYIRRYFLEVKIGRWKYSIPKRLRHKYSDQYKSSIIPRDAGWLLWSSWEGTNELGGNS